jgi:hypothetical protein
MAKTKDVRDAVGTEPASDTLLDAADMIVRNPDGDVALTGTVQQPAVPRGGQAAWRIPSNQCAQSAGGSAAAGGRP